MLTHDPDEVPEVSDDLLDIAETLGLRVIQVICDDPSASSSDPTATVNFQALMAFVPRAGDAIELENGCWCQVERVVFKVLPAKSAGKIKFIYAQPTVYAVFAARVPKV